MKKLWVFIIAGIMLRIFLSVSTYHSDMQVFDLGGSLIASGHILDLYDFSSSAAVFNYPPAIYLYHGFLKFLFGGISSPLLLKLPYFIFDLVIGILLFKLSERKVLAFTLWMFNPVSLYATYMMGQFDIIPTAFIVLAIYFAVKEKLEWAALALGFGIAFKIFPIFLVVPLIIFGKNYLDKLKLLSLTMLPYFISILPYLASQSFRTTALFANQSSKSLYANIPVSGGESIILFPAFLILFYLFIWGKKEFFSKIEIWKLYAVPLFLFFIFTHYHPQWLIWLTPFLILDLVNLRFKNPIPCLLIFFSWFASLFFFDPSLTLGMFAPLLPNLRNLPSIWTLSNINADYNIMRSLIQTVFAASSLYLVYQYFPVKGSK